MALGDVYEKTGASTWTKRATIVGAPGPAGAQGAAGVAEVWHSGSGVPSSGLGADGDWYLDNAGQNPALYTPPTVVTTLPSSPVDGQEVYYAADPSQGIMWHLRYRSGASGSYKWEYLGGSPLAVTSQTPQTGVGLGWTDITGATLSVPLAGDYFARWGADLAHSVATVVINVGVSHSGAVPISANTKPIQVAGVNYWAFGSREGVLIGVVAGIVKLMAHCVAQGNAQFGLAGYSFSSWMNLVPVRVA